MTTETNWEQRKPNITKITDQINDVLKEVVSREIYDISNKIDSLSKMGLLKDCEKLNEMKNKLKQLNLQDKL